MSARLVLSFVTGNVPKFVFQTNELPESLDWGKRANLKKINFPGGKQAVQTIGVYREPIEFTATFYGESVGQAAIERAINLQSHIGKIGVLSWYDTDDNAQELGKFSLEAVVPTLRNRFDVECKVLLHPHDGYEQLKGVRGSVVDQSSFGLGGLGGDAVTNLGNIAGQVADVRSNVSRLTNAVTDQVQSTINNINTVVDGITSGGGLQKRALPINFDNYSVVKTGTLPHEKPPGQGIPDQVPYTPVIRGGTNAREDERE